MVPILPLGTVQGVKMAAGTTGASSSRGISCPDRVVTLLLEAVRENECPWNPKSEEYKSLKLKTALYGEVLQVIKEELPDIDLPGLPDATQISRPLPSTYASFFLFFVVDKIVETP